MTQKIIFLGDSITDCGRNREISSDLGNGYVSMIQAELAQRFGKKYACINRGCSGDRSRDLLLHWQKRCIEPQAEIFSLYIGVNDTWRRYDQNDPSSAESFEKENRQLLEQAFDKTPATPASSILVQPFVLDIANGSRSGWREEDLDAKAAVITKLAKEYGTYYLPLQDILDETIQTVSPEFLAEDGVHPSPAGHSLIAREWLKLMAPVLNPA